MGDVKSFFDENGYYLAKGVFAPSELGPLETEFDRIVQQLHDRDHSKTWIRDDIIETRNVQQYSGVWMAALHHKPFLDLVEELIGPDIVLNHTMLFQKLPTSVPSPFQAHQDWSYLPTREDTMIAAMIHLSLPLIISPTPFPARVPDQRNVRRFEAVWQGNPVYYPHRHLQS